MGLPQDARRTGPDLFAPDAIGPGAGRCRRSRPRPAKSGSRPAKITARGRPETAETGLDLRCGNRTRTCRRQYLTSPYLVNTAAELRKDHWRWLTVVGPIRAWDGPQTAQATSSPTHHSGLLLTSGSRARPPCSRPLPAPFTGLAHIQIGVIDD